MQGITSILKQNFKDDGRLSDFTSYGSLEWVVREVR